MIEKLKVGKQSDTENIEQTILTGLIVDTEFCSKLARVNVVKYLSSKYSKILAGMVLEYYKIYGKAPDSSITEIIQDKKKQMDPTVHSLIVHLLENISERYGDQEEEFDLRYSLDLTERYLNSLSISLRREEEKRLLDDGKIDEIYKLAAKYPYINLTENEKSLVISGEALMEMEMKEPNWLIPGLIPEGLVLITSKAKVGKSWLALQVTNGIAIDGNIWGYETVKGPVLYLALEDTLRRLQSRMEISRGGSFRNLKDVLFANEWPRFDEGGLAKLEATIQETKGLRAVIIDCYKRIKAKRGNKNEYSYDLDYDELVNLKTLADRYGITIILIHHTRKSPSKEDPFDEILGSSGLMAAVDAAIVIKRERTKKDGFLWITGRDVQEAHRGVKFDPADGTWSLGEDVDAEPEIKETEITPERQEVLALLSDSETGMSPLEVSMALNKNRNTIRVLLTRMRDDYLIQVNDKGKYYIKG